MNLVASAGQPHAEVSLVSFDTESPIVSALKCPVVPRRVAFFLIAGCSGSLGYWQSLAVVPRRVAIAQ